MPHRLDTEQFELLKKKSQRYELFKGIFAIIVVGGIVVIVVLQAFLFDRQTQAIKGAAETTEQVRATQQESSSTLREVVNISRTIQDCIEPGGDCFDNAIKRANNRIDRTKATIIAAIACQNTPGVTSLQEITECVERELDNE